MSKWVPITEADLLAHKMAPLMVPLRNAALAAGQSDPVVELTEAAVTRVRNKVATCATNRVDKNQTKIPASLLGLTCRLILRAAKGRLEMPLTDDERKELDVDERELTAVALCHLVVEQPDDPIEPAVQAVVPTPRIKGRRKQFSREQQEGA